MLKRARSKPEPHRRVMVTTRNDDGNSCVHEQAERFIEHFHHSHRWQGTVIHIAANEERINMMLSNDLADLLDNVPLVINHVNAVKGPAQMPIRGVKKSHTSTLRSTPDT
ncbi:hypothetical protein GCM10027027_09960 [Neomicrococcus lactis]